MQKIITKLISKLILSILSILFLVEIIMILRYFFSIYIILFISVMPLIVFSSLPSTLEVYYPNPKSI